MVCTVGPWTSSGVYLVACLSQTIRERLELLMFQVEFLRDLVPHLFRSGLVADEARVRFRDVQQEDLPVRRGQARDDLQLVV